MSVGDPTLLGGCTAGGGRAPAWGARGVPGGSRAPPGGGSPPRAAPGFPGTAAQAALVGGLRVVGAPSLSGVVGFLRGTGEPPPVPNADEPASTTVPTANVDLADVRGQGSARRALEIAAAGGHNVLLTGPP